MSSVARDSTTKRRTPQPTLIVQPSSDQPKGLSAILAKLRTVPADSSEDTIDLVVRALQLSDAEPYEVLPFVEGRGVRSVQEEWGDNGKSYWAHFYRMPGSSPEPYVLLTLERDGGVDDLVGLFPSHAEALVALRRRGKYEAL